MIEIKKSTPLPDLVKLQQSAIEQNLSPKKAYKTLYGNLKEQVVEQLMKEQGYICAYCMRRIPDKRDAERGFIEPLEVKIEHWIARSDSENDVSKVLDYNNMLAVCSGNQNGPTRKKSKLTCDAKRENKKLTVNPLDGDTLSTIFYTENGIIKASDETINKDLNEYLNLNCLKDAVQLPAERKKVLEAIQEEVMTDVENEITLLENCQRLYNELLSITDKKPPYIGISLWWLKACINSLLNNT